jgi:hypothetical protein
LLLTLDEPNADAFKTPETNEDLLEYDELVKRRQKKQIEE